MSAAVRPEKILKDLQKLWIDLASEDSRKGSAGVLRACAMTLVASLDRAADAEPVSETIAELMHQHPSRAIVMRISPDRAFTLDARVFAQCWMPFGRRQQICCEEIEITASDSRMEDLPKLLLGIMAPDLPVVLWCRGERLCRNPAFQQLFPLTDKIIVDSAAFSEPDAALDFIREHLAKGRNVADLAWTRLTRLRETVAQIFENEGALEHLKRLRRVQIMYDGPAPAAAERYLTAWFRTTLPGVPVEPVQGTVAGVRLEGEGFNASVEVSGSVADVTVNRLTRRIAFPQPADCDLLREELSILGVDTAYRRCLG